MSNIHNDNKGISIFVFDYKSERDIEAIKKEAKSYYDILSRKLDNLNFKFVSLESNKEDNTEIHDLEDDVYYWSYDFEELLNDQKPRILHVFHDSLDAYQLIEKNFNDTNRAIVIFTVTGMEPLIRKDAEFLEHLGHAIDVGNLKIITRSKQVCETLSAFGLFSSYVPIKTDITWGDTEKSDNEIFTIGFASSPMNLSTWDSRGMGLLLDVAEKLNGYKFKIAWRNGDTELLDKEIRIRKLSNLEVSVGYIDMVQFYSEIDLILLPYTTFSNNHSSPLSVVEALVLGIPAIVTNVVGISDVIKKYDMGIVSSPTTDGIIEAISKMVLDYNKYNQNALLNGKVLFSIGESFIDEYKYMYERSILQEAVPTLSTWRRSLELHNKYLVMGEESIKKYYNNKFIAENYDEDRFVTYPMRTYDKLERLAINTLIENFGSDSESHILDIASGDGRILRELLKYGHVTALENSGFMISTSAKKISESDTVTYVKSNIFDFNSAKKFDLITMFRFLRHYNYRDRKKIYCKLHELLNEEGIILCEFPNKVVETQLRNRYEWHVFNVYDVFWDQSEIYEELVENKFKVEGIIPYGEMLLPNDRVLNIEEPLASVVCFRKGNK